MELDIKVNSDKENKFMNRREIEAFATYSGSTPGRDVVKQELCKKLNLNPDATAVVRIGQEYGSMTSSITLHSYKSKEEMLALEKEGRKKVAPAGKAESKPENKKSEEKEQKTPKEKKPEAEAKA